MGHVQISRFRYHPDHGAPFTHEQVQALADASANVKGVVSSRTFLSHEHVILFTEMENWATLDRIGADVDVKKARVDVFSHEAPVSAGTEQWSGHTVELLKKG